MQKRKTSRILAATLLAVLFVATIATVHATNPTGAWVTNDFTESNFTVYTGYVVFNGYFNLIPDSDGTTKFESANTFDSMVGTNYTNPQGSVYIYLDFNVTWKPSSNGQRFEVEMINNEGKYNELSILRNDAGVYSLEVKCDASPAKTNDSVGTFSTLPNQVILAYTGTWFVLYDTGLNVIASCPCTNSQSQTWTNYEFYIYDTNGAQIYAYSLASTLNAIQETSSVDISGMSSMVMSFVPIIILFAMLGMILGLVKKFTGTKD